MREAPVSPADVKERWSELTEKVTSHISSAWPRIFLPGSRVISADETTLTIGFPANVIDSMKGSFDEVRVRQALEEGLEKVIGKKLSVRIERDEAAPVRQIQSEHPRQSEESSDESLAEKVRTVKSIFPGAKIVR